MPRIFRCPRWSQPNERIVGITRRHRDLLVERRLVALPELLDSSAAVDLCVYFEEWMFVVRIAVRSRRGPPKVQPHPIRPQGVWCRTLVGKNQRVHFNFAYLVVL